ncbi:MAG: right-handed parallel beta-helix repeat-containing protein, partial [Planctomycetaceae bacterium]|nr:right-handed parallel beta-helix repeat-containing protein [Planctomycetaceae bacterium]
TDSIIEDNVFTANLIGIALRDNSNNNLVQRNTITASLDDGVLIESTSTSNSLLQNSIYANAGLAIDLGPDGVTANDALDADTGANNLQNFPVLTNALAAGSTFTVSGSLNTEANKTYRIEFFASTAADGSGYGEGERYLGYTTVLTDGSGDATFHASLLASVTAGEFISATATEDLGGGSYSGTSEFALSIAA